MKKLALLLIAAAAFFAAFLSSRAPQPLPPLARTVERIVIDKSDRRMEVYGGGKLLKTYPIALGFAPDGAKQQQGDGKTPEGVFRINRRNDRSRYHLSLGLDYPRPADRARAAQGGYSPGGDIFIHGQPNQIPAGSKLPGDWTAGCIAVTDAEIEELFPRVPIGTEVEIRP